MTLETKQLGNAGEDLAVKHLKKQGYKILDRNFRYKGFGEIDIIARNSEQLVFCEVKTRIKTGNLSPFNPEDNITYFKQKQLVKLAKIYLINKRIPQDISWQIDVIAIEMDPLTKKADLRHIEQAVEDIN